MPLAVRDKESLGRSSKIPRGRKINIPLFAFCGFAHFPPLSLPPIFKAVLSPNSVIWFEGEGSLLPRY